MTLRSRLWRIGAALFLLINVGGAGMAAASGEPLHTAVHVGLLVGGYAGWWLVRRRRREDLPLARQGDERLEYLQQSVDAIAIEVERIGEAQRFDAKLRQERAETAPLKSSSGTDKGYRSG